MSNTEPLPSLGASLPSLGGKAASQSGSAQPQVVPIQTQFQADTGLGEAMLGVLDQIVAHVLTQQPVDSQGKQTADVVYLQYQTGVGIDPRQYTDPWTPMGGSSLQSVLQSGQQAQQPQATAAPSGSSTSSQQPQVDTSLQASLMAGWETSTLADQMFLVDNTGQLQVYQSGSRSLAFAYGEIIKSMQPANPAQPSAQVQAAVQAAQAVLYQTDSQGNVTGPTVMYQNYLTNQMAWAQAKSNLAAAQAEAMTDPELGQVWPQMSATYQTAVDQAYSNWVAEGAPQVEQALATIESEGMDVVDAMVATAKQLFDAWSLAGLSGVPSETEYSLISPITWYDPTDDQIGFSSLTITSQSAASYAQQNTNSFSHSWYEGQSQSTSAGGGGMIFGITFGATGGASSASNAADQGSATVTTTISADQTSNVSITLEWLLCQVQRPWLVSDLFHVGGWYMVGQRKNTISDGTVAGQLGNQTQILPMIPTSFLVVRNVKITASNWGQAADSLSAAQSAAASSGESSSSNFGGAVGFLGLGGTMSHSQAQDSGGAASSSSGQLSWSWDGDSQQGTLTINGAQILGWVGAIVPACPPLDDPTLPTQTSGSSGSGSTSTQAPSGGSQSQAPPQPPSGLSGAGSNPVPSSAPGGSSGAGTGGGSSGS